MMYEGRSWSGHERHCCYLNLGGATDGTRFADVSSASGLDLDDDGRSLASCDWDGDGDLDLWIGNRNAPRLRFMRNEGDHARGRFIQFHLAGNGRTANRDAVGARVTVRPKAAPPMIQRVRAGEGFLSQSSKIVHFGLGEAPELDEVEVRWPDGEVQVFKGMTAGSRYRIDQGGQPTAVPPRDPETVALDRASPPTLPSPSHRARVPATILYPMPALRFRPIEGQPPPTETLPAPGRWLLVNLWATWCAPCLAELKEFRDRADDLQAAGVDLLALSVDGVATTGAGDPGAVAPTLKQLGFHGLAGHAEPETVNAIQQLDNYLTAAARPIPVPTSLLIDPNRLVTVIYKGPASVDQVIEDARWTHPSLEERRLRAAPLPGTLVNHPRVRRTRRELAATWNFRQGKKFESTPAQALHFFSEALEQKEDFHRARVELGKSLIALGQDEAAVAQLQSVERAAPDWPNASFELALLSYQRGRIEEARARFIEIHDRHPKHAPPLNNLAWLMATHPDPDRRDLQKAVELAHRAVALTKEEMPEYLDTLAFATAELGDVRAAERILVRAVEVAEAADKRELLPALRERLEQLRSPAGRQADGS